MAVTYSFDYSFDRSYASQYEDLPETSRILPPNLASDALFILQEPHVIRHYGKADNSLEKLTDPRIRHRPY